MPVDRHISPCPACRNRVFRKRFTKGGRDFWRCRSCGLEQQYPLPALEELRAYYDQSYASGMYKTFTAAEDMKRLTADRRLHEMTPHARSGRWLDVGCSNGVFVQQARSRGLDACGIDLSATAVDDARQRGLPVRCTTAEQYAPGESFDTVTAFDVLEHVRDPAGFLGAIHRLLSPGGVLALTVPNLASLARRIMGRRWYFYIPEEHLYYFDPPTIRALLTRTGFATRQCLRTYKPLTWRYSLLQFEEYNPLLHALLRPASNLLPARLLDYCVPLYIGEMLVIATRQEAGDDALGRREAEVATAIGA